uniref:SFRICE_028522 n=1 Tax=Spodoptera frugiperda TaxID=7108 RepID=A0A2H1VXK9_SPOFR
MPSNTLPDPGIEPETHCRYHSTKSDTLVRPNSYHTLCDAIHIAGDRTAWRNIVNLKVIRRVASLFVFYRIHFGECAGELHNLIPPSPFHHRTTRQSARRIDVPPAQSVLLQVFLWELLELKHIQLRRLFRIVWIAHRQCLHAMRTDDVIRNEYDAGLWTLTFLPSDHNLSLFQISYQSFQPDKLTSTKHNLTNL